MKDIFREAMLQSNSNFRFRLFIYLAGVELLLSGTITAFLAARKELDLTMMISILAGLTGLFGVITPILLKQRNNVEKRVKGILSGTTGRSFPFVVILSLTVFFCVVDPGVYITLLLSPLLVCVWLIGLEFLLLIDPIQVYDENGDMALLGARERMFGILSLLFAYGFLLLPSRIPTWFDGFPWDSPIEFLFSAFVLPLTFIIGWNIFTKRSFVIFLAFLFVVKFVFFSQLPQSGLGIYAFTSEEAVLANKWERSYDTFANPGYTQIINRPYYVLREFPVEWINKRFGYEQSQFWLKLELSGYITLQDNERLVLVTQGARQIQVELIDIDTQEIIPLTIIDRIEDANVRLYKSIPASHVAKIRGSLLYDIYGRMRLEPVLLYSDGSTKSLFESARVWTSLQGANYSLKRVGMFNFILDVMDLLFLTLMFAGLLIAVRALCRIGKISLIDLYLASSGSLLCFVALLVDKQYASFLVFTVILIFYVVKLADLSLRQRYWSGKAFVLSIGVAMLLMFFVLDINELRMVNNFPPIHDGLEYQTFAHNIFVKQDVFLVNTPPRAYKILFPYIVGILHVLFGQSVVPQLFLYAWGAVLSGTIIAELVGEFDMTSKMALSAAVFYLSNLFPPLMYMYYFRFGLIESFSTTFLLLTYYFAVKHCRPCMFVSGIFTVLLRLDYIGITSTVIILEAAPMLGSQRAAWTQFLDWLKTNWKIVTKYVIALCLPVVLIVFGYFLFIPGYMLNAPDTDQPSFMNAPESLSRVIVGGTIKDMYEKITVTPLNALLTLTPLLVGFLLILASTFFRIGIFKKLDLRVGLLALSLLPPYVFVRPTVYLPRFSLPLLPLDIIIICMFFHQLLLQWRSIGYGESRT